jgi:DNA-directed RNA polymerase III subunit RPC1
VLVNLECEERNYSKGGSTFLCAKDGYVAFRNSELISGNLAKKTLGGTAHNNTHT